MPADTALARASPGLSGLLPQSSNHKIQMWSLYFWYPTCTHLQAQPFQIAVCTPLLSPAHTHIQPYTSNTSTNTKNCLISILRKDGEENPAALLCCESRLVNPY
jgi:hypothetical protein